MLELADKDIKTSVFHMFKKTVCKSMLRDIKKIRIKILEMKTILSNFPGGTVVKNPPANARDTGSSPGPGRSHMPRSN